MLAFSGCDGDTMWGRALILQTGEKPWSFRVILPDRIQFRFEGIPAVFSQITGDAVCENGSDGSSLIFIGARELGGRIGAGGTLLVEDRPVAEGEMHCVTVKSGCYAFAREKGNWALAFRQDEVEAIAAAEQVMASDWSEVLRQRNHFFRDYHTKAVDSAYADLLAKALSVMKVNTESAGGAIDCLWSTPDRWPHQGMWLWDSAFHCVGMAHYNPTLALDFLKAMLHCVEGSGFLCHRYDPTGLRSHITQPHILGWALECLWSRGALDKAEAIHLLQLNVHFLKWCSKNRSISGNNLFQWKIEGNPLCRSGESGMDNSPRFDLAVEMDAVDFGSFLANDYAACSRLARALSLDSMAEECAREADLIAQALNRHLWNPETGFYHDRLTSGEFLPLKAVSGFMPLFAGIADAKQAASLVGHLSNPRTFGSAFPVPSVSLDSGVYTKDMWRGPTWINMNYLIILGLRRYGYFAEASDLRKAILDTVKYWYEQEGCLFEYYDSLGLTSPRELDRKQRLLSGKGMTPICDYHWTAALTAALILEETE